MKLMVIYEVLEKHKRDLKLGMLGTLFGNFEAETFKRVRAATDKLAKKLGDNVKPWKSNRTYHANIDKPGNPEISLTDLRPLILILLDQRNVTTIHSLPYDMMLPILNRNFQPSQDNLNKAGVKDDLKHNTRPYDFKHEDRIHLIKFLKSLRESGQLSAACLNKLAKNLQSIPTIIKDTQKKDLANLHKHIDFLTKKTNNIPSV
jgi:hypothetical protein